VPRKRRYQWIDSISTDYFVVNGAAAPGTISQVNSISEAEIENVGGAMTLIRTVGQILIQELLGVPVVTATLFLQAGFVGSTAPTDWVQDTFQRMNVLGTWLVGTGSNTNFVHTINVDLRTKRKLGQGVSLDLAIQNHSVATNNISYAYHLRHLVMLP